MLRLGAKPIRSPCLHPLHAPQKLSRRSLSSGCPRCRIYTWVFSPTTPAQSPNDGRTDPPPSQLSTHAVHPLHAPPSRRPSPLAQTLHPDRQPLKPSAPIPRQSSPD